MHIRSSIKSSDFGTQQTHDLNNTVFRFEASVVHPRPGALGWFGEELELADICGDVWRHVSRLEIGGERCGRHRHAHQTWPLVLWGFAWFALRPRRPFCMGPPRPRGLFLLVLFGPQSE